MATGGSQVASDEVPEFQCISCSNKVTVKYCIECQGYCCQPCVDAHSRFPTLKGHTLINPSKAVDSRNVPTMPMMPTEKCKIHILKVVDMYCKDHDEVGCTTCMALNHRSCTNVHSIPDDIDVLYSTNDMEDTNRSLQRSEKRLKNIEMKKKESLNRLTKSMEKALKTIDKAKEDLIDHVENLAKKSKEEVEKKIQMAKTQIDKDRQEANDRMEDLKKMTAHMKTSERNKSQQFVCMKTTDKIIKEAEEIGKTLQRNEEANISFEVDSGVQTFSSDIKTFGRVSCTMETKRYEVETIRDMNVSLGDDNSTCHIFDSCFTGDGRLLFVDSNNKKLKRVNIETMTVDKVCSFDNCPYFVCCTNKDEAVVTFYNVKFLEFVPIGTQITPSRKVIINHICWGITYKNDKLFITDDAKTLYIHDMAGNELQKVSTDRSGNGLFSNVRGISFSEYMKGSVVVEWNKGVIILNDQYERIAGYCEAELQGSASVCTDDRGSIFVCGYNTHNVLQIGYDGKKIGDVINRSNGIVNPLSLCFDLSKYRLIVTQGSNDIVKIIQLKK